MDIKPKSQKQYNPSRLEVAKTVALVALVVAVIAFVSGMRYANSQRATVDRAVEAAKVEAAQPLKQ